MRDERGHVRMKGVSPCICAILVNNVQFIHVQTLATVRGHMHCRRTRTVTMFFQKDKFFHFCTYARTDPFPLAVDGVAQDWPRGKEWWFVPVNLAKGLHRLNVTAVGTAQSVLEIRFGGPGAFRLDGSRFKRLVK